MRENKGKDRHIAKERSRTERKKGGRKERGSALLVCEGKCTEPYYLHGLLRHLDISTANVEIVEGKSRSNAVAVVNRARQRFDIAPRDRVFALIDTEQADLSEALKLCRTPLQRSNKKKGLPLIRIEPILSAPCFEFWLLLHFRYCDQPFNCFTDVLAELQAHLPDYHKNEATIFLKVGADEGLDRALLNTAKLRNNLERTDSVNPATDMDRLVEALRAIRG